MTKLAPVLLTALLACSCAENNFAGETGIRKGEAKPAAGGPKSDAPAPGSDTVDSADANKGGPGGTAAGKPTTKPGDGSDAGPGATTAGPSDQGGQPGDGGDTATQNQGGGGGGGPGFLDVLGGLLKQLKDVQVAQPNDNEIVFGGDKVFHIGDGQFSGSSCKFSIVAYPLTGTTYFFEFEVTEDDTQVDLAIEKVCGVDYGDSNFASVEQAGGKLSEQGIAKGAGSIGLPHQTMAKGTYSIVVESRRGAAENADDNDDYIVGLVHVTADKPIKPGRVGTR